MKKLLVASIVVALVAITAPLWAQEVCDVSLDGMVTFTKDVTIDQTRTDTATTTINKTFDPKARADAEAVKNDLNYLNDMWVSNSTFDDTMTGSFQFFQGIGQSNQAAGNMNNQNNVVSVAAGVSDNASGGLFCGWGGTGSMVAVAASELAMNNTSNTFCLSKADFSTSMGSSFIGFQGIGQSNQSAGNMNNQCNVVSVAAAVK
ncbi:MAG: hypothetical protein M0P73_08265 [Syntrophobacterales bacterium]|nr:hypothetical protein [Syntrophobacterales bacterium]